MTGKEYLSQVFKIDQRINIKLEQLTKLKALATKVNVTYSAMPASGTRNVHKMEDVICKIVELENDLNTEIDHMISLKKEIREAIDLVKDTEQRMLLEYRYLNCKTWEEISVLMGYSIRYIHKLHALSLKQPQFLKLDTK